MTEQSNDDSAQKLQDSAAEGYKFQVAEVPGELSDSQLDGVSGGAVDFFLKLGPEKGEVLNASGGKTLPGNANMKIKFSDVLISSKTKP